MEVISPIQIEEDLTRQFDPASAIIFNDFGVEEHYNMVFRTPETMRRRFAHISEELAECSELAVVDPQQYHATACIFPLSCEGILDTKNIPPLCREPLRLAAKGLHIRPNGIFVNTYSANGALGRLRALLAARFDLPFNANDRLGNVGWISLARFVATPSPELVAFVQSKVEQDFGTFTVKLSPHQSNNRQRLGPLVWQA